MASIYYNKSLEEQIIASFRAIKFFSLNKYFIFVTIQINLLVVMLLA
tara:strand:+ start:863 stop:1003 length:141 start_codon:yes stop_codon:yes gene_type:complete